METENQNLNETQTPAAAPAVPADDWKTVLPEDLRGAKEFDGIDGVEAMARRSAGHRGRIRPFDGYP